MPVAPTIYVSYCEPCDDAYPVSNPSDSVYVYSLPTPIEKMNKLLGTPWKYSMPSKKSPQLWPQEKALWTTTFVIDAEIHSVIYPRTLAS